MRKEDSVLARFGQLLGLPLVWDGSDQCTLLLDNQLMMSIHAKGTYWQLYCFLGQIDEQKAHLLFINCMHHNMQLVENNDGAVGYDSAQRTLLYAVNWPVPASGEELLVWFERATICYEALYREFSQCPELII
ncbi:MAG: CesT family type III secretion system chaperone [Candidatus Phlomobacter fragariae]